jgi:hypothetical protein
MEKRRAWGRKIIFTVGVVCCLISFNVILEYLMAKGFSLKTVLPRLIRFALTVLIFVLIYRGARWMTWIAIALFGVSGLYCFTRTNPVVYILGCIYSASAIMLALPQVKDYQLYKLQSKITSRRRLRK